MKRTLAVACIFLKSVWQAAFLRSSLTAPMLAPFTAHAADFQLTLEHEAAVNRRRSIFSQNDLAADIQRKGGFGSDMEALMRYAFDFAEFPGCQTVSRP